MTAAKITFEDGGARRMAEFFTFLRRLKIRVGYQDGEGKERHPNAPHLAVAHLAAIHEFGSDKVPAQSFIRVTINEKAGQLEKIEAQEIKAALDRVVAGGDPKREAIAAFAAVGSAAVRMIREKLATAKQRDGTRALDETGTLSRNLTWRVSAGRETFARGST